MNLNQSVRLSELPKVNIQRSKFDRSHKHTTTFNVGRLIPIYLGEVLPGQTTKIDTSVVLRLQTLIRPIMDNLYLDTYFFFVPNRIIWDHWKEFMGENSDSAWIPQVEHPMPTLKAPTGGFSSGSIADYFGIPINVGGLEVSALPFRAYAEIVNQDYRDQNLQTPIVVTKDDTSYTGLKSSDSAYDDQISCLQLGGAPFIAGKYHDRFTSCLPYPQKHEDVMIPLDGYLPVLPMAGEWDVRLLQWKDPTGQNNGRIWPTILGTFTGISSEDLSPISSANKLGVNASGEMSRVADTSFSNTYHPTFWNLGADLSQGVNASINDLRMSLALQRLYERDAMYGSRYTEMLVGQFGVRSADYRLQRPEFLGGDHIPLNIDQVINLASPSVSDQDPLGHVGAYSLTGKIHSDVMQSFTEHGWIIGLAVCRYEHSYQQGLHKMWKRFDRTDHYFPVFAEISNQPVYRSEIYATGHSSNDDSVFGYQEAWYDYRYGDYNHVTGEMRSGISNTLDSWHLADYYESAPYLSAEWIREDETNVDRCLEVSSSVSNQIFADFYFKEETVLPMPIYSIPSINDSFIK